LYLAQRIANAFRAHASLYAILPKSSEGKSEIDSLLDSSIQRVFLSTDGIDGDNFDPAVFADRDEVIRKVGPDVLVNGAFFSTDQPCVQATVIHDLIPLKEIESIAAPFRALWAGVIAKAVRHSDLIISISQFTKSDVEICFGCRPEHLVLFPDVRASIDRMRQVGVRPLASPGIIASGPKCPRKNADLVLRAYCQLRHEYGVRVPNLTFVGNTGRYSEQLRRLSIDLGCERQVCFLGHLSEMQFVGVAQASEGLVFPSSCEGFGMPVLEFLILRKKVVCSGTSAMPEVGGSIAKYCEVDLESIGLAMRDAFVLDQGPVCPAAVDSHLDRLLVESEDQMSALIGWIEKRGGL